MSCGTPDSGNGLAKGTVAVRVVEIAVNAPRMMVITCPERRPTTRNIDPKARKGMLRIAPNR